jgi:hypothetical protein
MNYEPLSSGNTLAKLATACVLSRLGDAGVVDNWMYWVRWHAADPVCELYPESLCGDCSPCEPLSPYGPSAVTATAPVTFDRDLLVASEVPTCARCKKSARFNLRDTQLRNTMAWVRRLSAEKARIDLSMWLLIDASLGLLERRSNAEVVVFSPTTEDLIAVDPYLCAVLDLDSRQPYPPG